MIYQLNKYPADRYNVLVPVTTLQAESNLQKITVSEVQLDTRQNYDNKGPSKDIYFEKSSNGYAITKVGGMKLAAAANISIISTTPGRTEGCQRCIEMARATGKPAVCGTCPHTYDVAVTVTIRVPEPSGGFRIMSATKEIDCVLTSQSMTDAQYKHYTMRIDCPQIMQFIADGTLNIAADQVYGKIVRVRYGRSHTPSAH